jgi:ubiquitin-conjugating enzyme E2 S
VPESSYSRTTKFQNYLATQIYNNYVMSSITQSYSRPTSSQSLSSENLPPRAMARVAREVRDLMKESPEGTKLVVDSESGLPASLGEITAEIQGPVGTPYASYYFQLKLVLPGDFPHSPPRGYFLTKIYHPNVDMSTGAICVNTLKRDWNPNVRLGHVLSVIRCLLIVPFPESSLNDEAGKLFMESYEEYANRAKLMANVHGKITSCVADRMSLSSSPVKNSKENEVGYDIKLGRNSMKSTSITPPSTVLKQSNPSERNCEVKNVTSLRKKNTSSRTGIEKKSKKKSLRRL